MAAPSQDSNVVEPSSVGMGTGLKGAYYGNRNLTGPAVERLDAEIDFNWGKGPPIAETPSDGFSVRWEGEVEALYSEPHLIHLQSDDRARLWLDGDLVIDEWADGPLHESTAWIQLEAGRRYLIRVEFYQSRGDAIVWLGWSSPSIPNQVIPTTQLYPNFIDANDDGIADKWETRFSEKLLRLEGLPGVEMAKLRRKAY